MIKTGSIVFLAAALLTISACQDQGASQPGLPQDGSPTVEPPQGSEPNAGSRGPQTESPQDPLNQRPSIRDQRGEGD